MTRELTTGSTRRTGMLGEKRSMSVMSIPASSVGDGVVPTPLMMESCCTLITGSRFVTVAGIISGIW